MQDRHRSLQEWAADIVETCPSGSIMIEEGAPGTSADIVLSGTAEACKGPEKRHVTLAPLDDGHVFGEKGPISASVGARTEPCPLKKPHGNP